MLEKTHKCIYNKHMTSLSTVISSKDFEVPLLPAKVNAKVFEALRHLFSTSGMVQIYRLCPTVPRHFLVEILMRMLAVILLLPL